VSSEGLKKIQAPVVADQKQARKIQDRDPMEKTCTATKTGAQCLRVGKLLRTGGNRNRCGLAETRTLAVGGGYRTMRAKRKAHNKSIAERTKNLVNKNELDRQETSADQTEKENDLARETKGKTRSKSHDLLRSAREKLTVNTKIRQRKTGVRKNSDLQI
jgi:hypothetical protein